MKIQEILSPISVTYSAEDKLSDASAGMNNFHHSCALVCDLGKLIGIITERDIVRHTAKNILANTYSDPVLKDFMTLRPMSVSPQADLSDAIVLAHTNNLRHLPVVDYDNVLVGVVTQTNMMNAWLSLNEKHKELQKMNTNLKWQALEDTLTGLANRRAMEMDLTQIESLSRRHKNVYSIALMDIDLFKPYNDHYGHDAGDDALRHVAQTLKSHIRESDKLYRYGGEEFLYLMPETTNKGALIVCDRLRETLRQTGFEHCKSPLGVITISIGTASTIAGDWEEVVRQADTALYKAKEMGRNRVCLGQHFTDYDASKTPAIA